MMKDRRTTITSRKTDFSTWYQDVIAAADFAEHSGVKGSMVIKPTGYAVWERMQQILDAKIKETGHQNAYFPLLIPEEYLKREKDHVEGFSPELAVVTHAGGEKLAEPLVIRPTSETIIYATYAKWIQSYRDLPLLINQWANVVRWELRPRLFLRTTEFLWQEGHTAHATEAEAEDETRKMLGVYEEFARDVLAIPVVAGQKTEGEKFAGALRTYTIEALMQDGKALQAGTSHNLGQNFAKVFEVMFTDQEGGRQHVWQTSWGVSTRLIGALIMSHSDDRGLVLPPALAPHQVVVVPIARTDDERGIVHEAIEKIMAMASTFRDEPVRMFVDRREHLTMGEKLYEWEKKGIPVRVEVGPRDLADASVTLVRRDTGDKVSVKLDQLQSVLSDTLGHIQHDLLHRAETRLEEQTYQVDSYTEFTTRIEQGGFFKAMWCGDVHCEERVSAETKATIRCIPFVQPAELGMCLVCGSRAAHEVIWARAY